MLNKDFIQQRTLLLCFVFLILLITSFFKFRPFFNDYFHPQPSTDANYSTLIGKNGYFFESDDTFEMNEYETEEGLISFQYLNHLTVKLNRGIYFVEDLKNHRVVFQIFEAKPLLSFDESEFSCIRYQGDEVSFQNKTLCFTKAPPEGFIANLQLFGAPHRFFKKVLGFFSTKNLIDPADFHSLDFFTRAEALKLILSWRYPQKDFSSYAEDCFDDIAAGSVMAGYACYAKEQEIIVGIGGNFYPDQTINLHGLLKILFKVFEVEDLAFNEAYLDQSLFEQMQTIHIAYPLIAKAYYEGLFRNDTDQIHWANRHVYKGEALSIMHRFFEWTQGRQINRYYSLPTFSKDTRVYRRAVDFVATFEEKGDETFDDNDLMVSTQLVPVAKGLEVYFLDKGGVYQFLVEVEGLTLPDVKSVFASFDSQRFKGKLVLFDQDSKRYSFKLKRKQIDFSYLKKNYTDKGGSVEAINRLEVAKLLPSVAKMPTEIIHPQFKLYMDEYDFESIIFHRTGNNRYPAYLEMIYPDGSQFDYSVLIKTRGNANRGYIKSGYTIESFVDFSEDFEYNGDEFMEGADEFKMRGFINEETMIHEKVFYETFERLGNFSPDFFDATFEINGVSFGFYQITEAIKNSFFKRREVDTNDYYYARNSGSLYNTNLGYYENDEITLSQYKYDSSPDRLIQLIKRIDLNDPTLINDLNVENIFDYALSVFLMQANDSLTHNFYLYFDESTQKWNIFPWDADDSLYSVGRFNIWDFLAFARRNEGTYNRLIYYVFSQLSFEEIQDYFNHYAEKWNEQVNLEDYLDTLLNNADYYRYDNMLWNGHFLERKKIIFDTVSAINDFKEMIAPLYQLSP